MSEIYEGMLNAIQLYLRHVLVFICLLWFCDLFIFLSILHFEWATVLLAVVDSLANIRNRIKVFDVINIYPIAFLYTEFRQVILTVKNRDFKITLHAIIIQLVYIWLLMHNLIKTEEFQKAFVYVFHLKNLRNYLHDNTLLALCLIDMNQLFND